MILGEVCLLEPYHHSTSAQAWPIPRGWARWRASCHPSSACGADTSWPRLYSCLLETVHPCCSLGSKDKTMTEVLDLSGQLRLRTLQPETLMPFVNIRTLLLHHGPHSYRQLKYLDLHSLLQQASSKRIQPLHPFIASLSFIHSTSCLANHLLTSH